MTTELKHEPAIVADADTPEWYEARKTGIGASEAAAACGQSQYKTPYELYLQKRGEIPETEENDAMWFGKQLEPVVVAAFERATGKKLTYPVPMMRHPKHEWMLATLDAYISGQDGIEEIVECKTTGWRTNSKLGEDGSDEIFDDWLFQAQHQMAVTGASVCHFAVLVDGRELRLFVVERSEQFIQGMIGEERKFWGRVKNGDEPEPEWDNEGTPDLIKKLYPEVEESVVTLDDSATKAYLAKSEIDDQIRELKKQSDSLKAQLMKAVGANSGGILPGTDMMVKRSIVNVKESFRDASSYTKFSIVKNKEKVSDNDN